MVWREILHQLEARLEVMVEEGVGYLTIPEQPALADMLKAYAAALPPQPGGQAPARARDDSAAAAPGPSQAGRAAGVASQLRGDAQGGPAAPDTGGQAAPSPAPGPPQVAGDTGEGAHPADIQTLESLAFRFRNCTACGLSGSRNRLVFGTGQSRPALLFIGEGPGAEEDRLGLPFVGRAGALLAGFIKALGLTREDVYITNVVKCRPPGNRNPEPAEVAACRPILERQIELLNPRLIVTLGNVPLKVFKPSAAGITRERGTPFTYKSWSVLPTFHPSYLLRSPSAIETCWSDFKQAFQLAYGAGGG